MAPLPWMDSREATLNPCSLETIPEPVRLANGSSVWPLMLSCYQLDDDESHTIDAPPTTIDNGQSQQQQPLQAINSHPQQPTAPTTASRKTTRRRGHMDLHMVKVPDIAGSNLSSMPLELGKPETILNYQTTSGILDGKWSSIPDGASKPAVNCDTTVGEDELAYCFASAHATGEIRLHGLHITNRIAGDDIHLESDPLYRMSFMGQSDSPNQRPQTQMVVAPSLCLSLSWMSPAAYKQNASSTNTTQLVSSYSNGRVAIHDVSFSKSHDHRSHRNGPSTANITAQLVERDSWMAHHIFTSPAEVWSCCFWQDKSVLTCGDEGQFKLWDTRATTRPMQVIGSKDFTAGVTSVSPHPNRPHWVACGSYDETVALYDIRFLQRPLLHTKQLGGGIWRIKWHPYIDHRVLVAVMHGGCRILQVYGDYHREITSTSMSTSNGLSHSHADIRPSRSFPLYSDPVASRSTPPPTAFKVKKKFTAHESMCYGADWLTCRHPTRNGYFEAAASCSFYDRSVYLWDTVF